jgi:ubiquinone/menaquinone biosynthesis C-methylase UbiE
VLHLVEGNPQATIVAELSNAPQIKDDTFDCIICTQTLQFIPNVMDAIKTLHRILKPDGVVLATAATISQLDFSSINHWVDHWRFTSHGFKWLFINYFKTENVLVSSYGNVLVSVSFLHGLAVEELDESEILYKDPAYEMVVAVRAKKPGNLIK